MSKIKELKQKMLADLSEICKSETAFAYAQDYLATAKSWKYMVANKSSFSVKEAKQCLIKYKNNRDRLMPICKEAVEFIDKEFPIEIEEVQQRPDTQIAKLAGARLRDLEDEKIKA